MAKKIINEKGFKVIALTPAECFKLGFGFRTELVCGVCNKLVNNDAEVYYIPVLMDIHCKSCFEEWYKYAVYFQEDEEFEEREYNIILKTLKNRDIEIVEETYNP